MKIKISENRIWSLVIFAFLTKLLFFFYLKWFPSDEPMFGGGNDADYYHGLLSAQLWPVFEVNL